MRWHATPVCVSLKSRNSTQSSNALIVTWEEKKHDLQYVISVSVSILAILFITLAVYLYISMKKLAQMRQNLSIANGS